MERPELSPPAAPKASFSLLKRRGNGRGTLGCQKACAAKSCWQARHILLSTAAQLLDLDIVRVEIASNFRADVSALESAVSERTILIVASAPSLPFGLIDPVEEIAQLASRYEIWCHVDACVGGYIA